ncbi:MAG: hypothetical protein WCJ18_08925 [Planctomycetota bacterium]
MAAIARSAGRGDHGRPPTVTARVAIGLFALAILGGGGCGPRGPARHQLEGQVTFRGKPVPSGLIRFEPDASKGNRGPVGYAAIVNGRYTTATRGSKGALKGPLVAFMTGGPAPDPKVEFPKMWFEEYRTTIDLDPASGVTRYDFDVPEAAKQ